MPESDWLAKRFEEHRSRLRGVAYRMLGSLGEADDAVQEAWLRLSRSDTSGVQNLAGWLTTVVARVCLDMLRSRQARREESLGGQESEPLGIHADGTSPEQELLLVDSLGIALLVVLETLAPEERLAFVLHDLFVSRCSTRRSCTGSTWPPCLRAHRRWSEARSRWPGGRSPARSAPRPHRWRWPS